MSLAPQDIIDFGAEAHSFTSIVPIESRQNLVLLRARASPPSASARRASAPSGGSGAGGGDARGVSVR